MIIDLEYNVNDMIFTIKDNNLIKGIVRKVEFPAITYRIKDDIDIQDFISSIIYHIAIKDIFDSYKEQGIAYDDSINICRCSERIASSPKELMKKILLQYDSNTI